MSEQRQVDSQRATTRDATLTELSFRLVSLLLLSMSIGLTSVVVEPAVAFECPSVAKARSFARKAGNVSFAVNCGSKITGYETWRQSSSASTGKALLLVSYLRSKRNIGDMSSTLSSMIRYSDNAAASRVYAQLGDRPLKETLRRAKMARTRLCGCWASIRWSPRDYSRLFSSMPSIIPKRHRAWAMNLFRSVIPSQKWGIPVPSRQRGFGTYLKGGWRTEAGGWIVLQGALLRRRQTNFSIAVFTRKQQSVASGASRIERIARLVLEG